MTSRSTSSCLHNKPKSTEIGIWLIAAIEVSKNNLENEFKNKLSIDDHEELLGIKYYLCHKCIIKILCKSFMKKLIKTALKHKNYICIKQFLCLKNFYGIYHHND